MNFKNVLFPFGLLLVLPSCASSKNLESDQPMHLPLAQQTPIPSSANPAAPVVLSASPVPSPAAIATVTPPPSVLKKLPAITCLNSVGASLTPESPGFDACMMEKNNNKNPQK